VCDRYAFSGVAFSAAKGTLSIDWCKAPDRGLPKPDLVLFLDVSAEVAKTRGGYGEERYEKEEFQARVRKAFETLRAGDADTNWQESELHSMGTAFVLRLQLSSHGRTALSVCVLVRDTNAAVPSAQVVDANQGLDQVGAVIELEAMKVRRANCAGAVAKRFLLGNVHHACGLHSHREYSFSLLLRAPCPGGGIGWFVASLNTLGRRGHSLI
jgi:hypothetical protein